MEPKFNVLTLGVTGGPRESDISGYMFYPIDNPDESFIVDAGTLINGIIVADERGNLKDFECPDGALTDVGEVFLKKIKGYFISHAHLDHISALVINSQVDGAHKFIAGTDKTIEDLKAHIFNNVIWPNYANEGAEPMIRQYDYVHLPLHQMVDLPNLSFKVECHKLAHPHEYASTAFLFEYKEEYLLYFGDTSPDALESEKHLIHVWKRIAPLIREGKFHGMLLECSVPDADSAQVVYGHLNPQLLMQEMHVLQEEVGGSLAELKVIVTHRKESLLRQSAVAQIADQIRAANTLDIQFIFPMQGDRIPL
ncbi:MAG: hypothetical protein S4CHLAM81_02540 [Chlamydiales bacterium]|nr:hypothetical protein [Chlamydiales bacterium]MCH9635046.1 hypothetical protein [Chlamydiales bacterium]MCH9703288.1 3',5'-cyclic-nucleotide phosphodiesterase [Chlamydiota bacterium]